MSDYQTSEDYDADPATVDVIKRRLDTLLEKVKKNKNLDVTEQQNIRVLLALLKDMRKQPEGRSGGNGESDDTAGMTPPHKDVTLEAMRADGRFKGF